MVSIIRAGEEERMNRFNSFAMIIICLCLGISITSGIVISPFCTEESNQKNPAISGEIIVWQDDRDSEIGVFDIYLQQVGGSEQAVCTEEHDQRNAAISGTTIVWQDKRNFDTTGWDIYMWDPSGGEQVVWNEPDNQMVSDISGNIIIWKEYDDIFRLELGSVVQLVREGAGDTLPVIDGDIIVWQDDRNMAAGGWDIYKWDPVHGEQPVCTDPGDQILPAISGDTIVWQDNRSFETTGWDIYKWDPTGGVQLVCNERDNQLHAKISGDKIVWTDYRDGDTNGYDVYLWDPVGLEQPLCVEPEFQGEPDISGDIVVWEDARNRELSGYDLYIAYLSLTAPVSDAGPDQNVLVGEEVQFDGSESSDPDGSIVSYSWDFDDGSSGSGETPSHTYTAAGRYTATLTVTDNDSLTDTDSVMITVQAPPVADAGDDQTVLVGEEVQFDGSESSDPDGSIVSYSWDFDDGSSGSGETPSHTYTAAGRYTATLTVTDNDSLTDTDSVVITVQAPPVADAGPDYTVQMGEEVSFNGSGSFDSDGIIVSYDWTFSDGFTSRDSITTHAFSAAGIYEAILTVTDNDGLTDIDAAVITVQTPQQGMGDLITAVESLELPFDIETGLTDKLDAAIEAANRGNNRAAVNQLNAFINQVNGLVGSTFTREEADVLIREARDIITALGM